MGKRRMETCDNEISLSIGVLGTPRYDKGYIGTQTHCLERSKSFEQNLENSAVCSRIQKVQSDSRLKRSTTPLTFTGKVNKVTQDSIRITGGPSERVMTDTLEDGVNLQPFGAARIVSAVKK